ncbi:MAG: DUF3306 domain-containing protein [Granulosicoccus sp.]
MSDKPDNGSFLGRWSARKRQADQDIAETVLADDQIGDEPAVEESLFEQSHEASAPIALVPVDDRQNQRTQERVEPDEPPLLTDDDMPPIESLSSSSDLSGFFNKGVSAALRKAALRHVFQQPQFNIRDGLNDYDGDYTVFEPLGDTVTSDMKWHIARKERERLEAEAMALEEQEQLALNEQVDENQAHENDETEIEQADEDNAMDEHNSEVEEVSASQSEQHDHTAEEANQQVLPEQLPDHASESLLHNAESAMNTGKLLPGRVAGKLRRTDRIGLPARDKPLQLSDTEPGHNANAKDHEE